MRNCSISVDHEQSCHEICSCNNSPIILVNVQMSANHNMFELLFVVWYPIESQSYHARTRKSFICENIVFITFITFAKSYKQHLGYKV